MAKENESCKRILAYIENNPTLDSSEKRILLSYVSQLYVNDMENVEKLDLEDIFNDIKELNKSLETSDSTSLVARRLNEELKLYEMLRKFMQGEEQDLSKISYELDQLYLRSNLKVRKKSDLSYYLTKRKENGRVK